MSEELECKIKIVRSGSDFTFPYGLLHDAERKFIKEHDGEVFTATRHNMNYYKLENGMLVHVYNTVRVDWS